MRMSTRTNTAHYFTHHLEPRLCRGMSQQKQKGFLSIIVASLYIHYNTILEAVCLLQRLNVYYVYTFYLSKLKGKNPYLVYTVYIENKRSA